MKVQQFLAHHGLVENPFGQEDAQSDHVFKERLLDGTHHPAWDKIYGNPKSPSTSVVFGEKGSGKTALRLQIAEQLRKHNDGHPDRRVFIVEYDDFNPFLDSFRERLHGRRRKPHRALAHWRLWDHMDAILALAVDRLAKKVLAAADRQKGRGTDQSPGSHAPDSSEAAEIDLDRLRRLPRPQKRDLLLLAAFYDHTYEQPKKQRFAALRRAIGFSTWKAHWDLALGILVTLATAILAWRYEGFTSLWAWWAMAIYAAGWLPWLWRQARLLWTAWRIKRQIRVFDHQTAALRKVLAEFERQELFGQPIPSKNRSDDRYELLYKLQSLLKSLGYSGIVVIVDRVDEPHLVNGSAERIRDLLWPIFDNKFLKQADVGFKLLLPSEVTYYLNREEKAFYERSRLDKQNVILSLVWTGQSLYDIANDRLRACAEPGADGQLRVDNFFDDSIVRDELIQIFARLRVPRHLFKFLYRLIVDHCNHHTDEHPSWKISRETLQATLALYLRDMEAIDKGIGPG